MEGLVNIRKLVLISVAGICFLSSQSCRAPKLSTGTIGQQPQGTERPLPPVERVDSPYTASLVVRSVPSGAQVFLDDEFKGLTPTRIDGLGEGFYQVRLTLDGYNDYSHRVWLREREMKSIEPRLNPVRKKSQ